MLVSRGNLRSRGCFECIRRRVKCDQTKPSCSNCVRRKQHCPGYRDYDDLHFRNTHILSIPAASDSWRQEVLSCFVANFTLNASESGPGYAEYIVDMLADSTCEDVAFTDAIMATATTYLARRRNQKELHVEALRLYIKALRSLHTALSDSQTAAKDSTLAAVVLLSTRDIITGELATATSPHNQAELVVLQAKSARRTLSPRAAQIKSLIRIGAAIRGLLIPGLALRLAPEYCPDSPQSFRDVVILASAACTDLRRALPSNQDYNADSIAEILTRILWLEETSRQLVANVTKEQTYRAVPYRDKNAVDGFGLTQAYVFSHLNLARSWVLLWCGQIRLLEALAMCLARTSQTDDRICEVRMRLERSSDPPNNICAIVPYMAKEIDEEGHLIRHMQDKPNGPGAMLCSAALYVAGCSEAISPAQKTWITERLNYIGHERAIGQALRFKMDLESPAEE